MTSRHRRHSICGLSNLLDRQASSTQSRRRDALASVLDAHAGQENSLVPSREQLAHYVASGVRISNVLHFQKPVVDVKLDRAVAFQLWRPVPFVKALSDESPQPVPERSALGGVHRGIAIDLRFRKPDRDDAA